MCVQTLNIRLNERDEIAVEEPLEIRVDGEALSVTMRTPGNDEELALGFLYGEGLINEPRAAGPESRHAGLRKTFGDMGCHKASLEMPARIRRERAQL